MIKSLVLVLTLGLVLAVTGPAPKADMEVTKSAGAPKASKIEDGGNIYRVIDPEYGVICYHRGGHTLSCVKQ